MNEELIKKYLQEIKDIEEQIEECNKNINQLKKSIESDNITQRIKELKKDQIIVSVDKKIKELKLDSNYVKIKEEIKKLKNSDDSKQRIKEYKEELTKHYETINDIQVRIIALIKEM